MNIDISTVVSTLRAEAEYNRNEAIKFQEVDCIWIARTSAAHVLYSLAHALALGAIQSCRHAESSSSQSATKTVEDSSPQ